MVQMNHRQQWIPGVKIKDAVVGSGPEVTRRCLIIANVRMHLNHGAELVGLHGSGSGVRIDLRKQHCISGLRYGIVGMRVGGRRNLVISPHLAFGLGGLPDRVPHNAVIRCRVELLAVHYPECSRMSDLATCSRFHFPSPVSPGEHAMGFSYNLGGSGTGQASILTLASGNTDRGQVEGESELTKRGPNACLDCVDWDSCA